jgi:acyl-CoA thioesterase
MLTPREIIAERMLKKDSFSQWLGIKVMDVGLGRCTLKMEVNESMLNGFKIGHGGITYSLSDSAFAFASNSHGYHAVSIESSISHIKPIFENDILIAKAVERSRSRLLGVYDVEVTNQDNKLVALFKGTAFIKNTQWV